MLRSWCLAVLLCLSIWTIGSRAVVCQTAADPAAPDATCALGVPSGDDAADRHWEAPRTAACPTASVWTSQVHHAVLAGLPCHDGVRAPDARNESARQTPRAVRPQIQSPLLI